MGGALMVLGWLLFIPATLILRGRASKLRAPASTKVCPECGYSRAGFADDAPCPECGKPLDRAAVRAGQRTMVRRWALYTSMFAGILGLYGAGLIAHGIVSGRQFDLPSMIGSTILACALLAPVGVLAPVYLMLHDNARRGLSPAAAWCLGANMVIGAVVGALWCAWESLSLPPRSFGHGMALLFVSLPAAGGAGFGAFLGAAALGMLGDWDDKPDNDSAPNATA